MRFRRRVVNQRVPLGEHSGHDRVFRRGHRRFVEKHLFSFECLRAHSVFVRGDLDLCAEGFEGQEMRVDSAAADDIAAGLGDIRRPASRE